MGEEEATCDLIQWANFFKVDDDDDVTELRDVTKIDMLRSWLRFVWLVAANKNVASSFEI